MHSSKRKRVGAVVRGAISAFVFLCTIEALYWPLFVKPGQELQLGWWQAHWLAQIGFCVGCVPINLYFLIALHVPLSQGLLDALLWLLTAAWSFFLFWVLGFVGRLILRLSANEDQAAGCKKLA